MTKTKLKIANVDNRSLLNYLRLTMSNQQIREAKVGHLLPVRISQEGEASHHPLRGH